tara:strand:- start:291 stop:1298 length:1008 start_codon:yes stop_codon:yes gene_type:complete
MKKYFPYVVLISALSLAGCAAYYSVYGLSKLFSAQATAVIIMASILEAAKLITATYLHKFWKKVNVLLKTYLTIAVIILMMITSLGIYGFLTSAYQTTSDELTVLDKQTNVVEMKKSRFQEQLNSYSEEKKQLSNSITELTKGLSNNKIQYRDKETNQIITTTSSSTRRVLQGQLNDFKTQRNNVSVKIEALTDSITKLDLQVLDINSNSDVTSEVGPLKYISNITKLPMDNIVNYFVLAFIFVFDPLAVLLLISANKAFELKQDETDYLLSSKANKEHLEESIAQADEAEKRMDIIGQNGNDGLHYEEEPVKEDIYKEKKKDKKNRKRNRGVYW